MDHMNFLCIDDDIDFLHKMKNKYVQFSVQQNIDINIKINTSIPKEVPSDIDAYFLDVELGNEKIFDFIMKVRLKDQIVPILIISNYDHYVLDSVKFNIFDFIRKQYFDIEIDNTLNRLILYLDNLMPTLVFKSNNTEISLKIKDIMYIETYSHYTVIHTKNNFYDIKKDTAHVLQDKQKYFIRAHRSYFINPIYVQSMTNNKIILTDDIEIPIGKKYLSSVKNDVHKKYIFF